MTKEVPLSEFLTDEEPEPAESSAASETDSEAQTADTTADAAADREPPVDPSTVAPIDPTSAYDPAGVTCDGCGNTVNRRIQTNAGLRCLECVSWNPER